MSYLVLSDYKKQIQAENLSQVIGSDTTILEAAQLAAQAEAISYLIQKYEVDQEFTDTTVWDKNKIYYAGDRIVIDFPAYAPASNYNIGDTVSSSGNGYICIEATTGVFDATKWTLIGKQGAIYYGKYPNPIFNIYSYYKKGSVVFWHNKNYTAIQESIIPGHASAIQYGTYKNIPPNNVFPDDPYEGANHWGAGVSYDIPAGTLLADTNFWTEGDNRNQQMVMYFIDITLYHVHSRISPRNIPELRMNRYDLALNWLRMAGKGEITAGLPLIQPKQGGRIRFGGNVKQINSY
jgi:hypothetical protein